MKKLHKKSLVLLIALALLLTCAVSGTAAFLSAGSGPVTNNFTPAELDTVIEETFGETFDGSIVKSAIRVRNKGSIDAYVRVGVYGYWAVKDRLQKEKIVAPWSFNGTPNTGWVKNGDWYYYTSPLAPGKTSGNLLSASIQGTDKPANYPNAYLVVHVIHQSIQTEPAQALTDAHWGWTPSE